MNTPTSRTLKLLRDDGWNACVVEKWIAQTQRRVDAFGFGDVLACRLPNASPSIVPETPSDFGAIVLVQATSASNVAARVTKITTECVEAARAWCASGGRIVVVGWSRKGARGKRKLWTPSFREVTP